MLLETSFAPVNRGHHYNLWKQLPPLGCDLPEQGGIGGNLNLLKNLPNFIGCDMPSQGGISGTLGKKPPKFVCYMA